MIYFYKKQNGELIDLPPETAWKVHVQYITKKGYSFVGRSDGKHLQEVRKKIGTLKRNEKGIAKDFTKTTKTLIQKAIQMELRDAAKDKTAPSSMARKSLDGAVIQDNRVLSHINKLNQVRQ